MFKKTEEVYSMEREMQSGTELVNQESLFAKARAYSNNDGNWFSEDDDDDEGVDKNDLNEVNKAGTIDSDGKSGNTKNEILPTFGTNENESMLVEKLQEEDNSRDVYSDMDDAEEAAKKSS